MTSNNLPDWLTGVWRRLSIETEDGLQDTKSQVIWLQTHSCFGDIRIPADRPNLGTKSSLAELTKLEMIALSKQQGFAGVTHLNGSTSQWHRYIDYQPLNAGQDIGSLHWEGEILIELGVEAVYKEEWQRLDDGNGDFTALILPAEIDQTSDKNLSWQGCLVTAGDYFIYVWNRSLPLPPADSLTSLLINSAQDHSKQIYCLDCEISFGVCKSGQVPWEIRLSTLPWREGYSLWSLSNLEVDLKKGQVLQTINQSGRRQIRHWTIQEWGTGSAFKN